MYSFNTLLFFFYVDNDKASLSVSNFCYFFSIVGYNSLGGFITINHLHFQVITHPSCANVYLPRDCLASAMQRSSSSERRS
jgi:hypothetical protein